MKLGEVVVHIEYYNFTKFHHILMKKIIVLYQTHLMDVPSVRGRWIGPKMDGEAGLTMELLRMGSQNHSAGGLANKATGWVKSWVRFWHDPSLIQIRGRFI